MLFAQPKLQALLLRAFGDMTPEKQANQTASGYHHTYFKADDLDLEELMRYPTDNDFVAASDAAFKEAEQLLASVGINAEVMLKAPTEHIPVMKKEDEDNKAFSGVSWATDASRNPGTISTSNFHKLKTNGQFQGM